MNDYRDVLERSRAQYLPEPDAFERLRRRRDRKRRNERIAAAVVALIILIAVVGGAVSIFRASQKQTPADPVPFAPDGFRPAVLPLGSIAYPTDWALLDLYEDGQTDEGPVLQLTNFDAGLQVIDCQGLPPDGVALEVSETGIAAGDTLAWPVSLAPTEPEAGSGCPGALGATWQGPSGIGYEAQVFVGEQASAADRQALQSAFESMLFPELPPTEVSALGTAPRLVLDTGMSGDDLVMLIASRDADGVWLAVSGPIHSANPNTPTIYLASTRVRDGRDSDSPVNMGLDGGSPVPFSVAWGTVRPGVDHVDIVNDGGEHFPVTFVPFPPSLGQPELAAWAFVRGPITVANAVPYDAQGKELGSNWYATAPADVLATGVDPVGGPWVMSLTHSNIGDGIRFAWTDRGDSGGACCFSNYSDPRRHPLQVSGYSAGEPGSIEAIVSADAARIAFESAGQTVDGLLVGLPDKYLGPAQVAEIFVPSSLATGHGEGGLIGDVVTYDAQGAEIARTFIGGPEPSVPSPEVDTVWQSLARARDAILAYTSDESALADLSASTLSELEPLVPWNLGPEVVPGQVTASIQPGATAEEGSVLLRDVTPSGDAYCVAMELQPGSESMWGGPGYSVRYGHGDAATVVECRGGWD